MDLKMEQTTSNPQNVADEKQHGAVQDSVYIDPQEEKALLRKLDRWIVPPVMLLYLFSLVLTLRDILTNATHADHFVVCLARPASRTTKLTYHQQLGQSQHRKRTPVRHGERPRS